MRNDRLPIVVRLRLARLYRRLVRRYVREGQRRPMAETLASFDVYGGDTHTVDAEGISRPDSELCPEAEKIWATIKGRRRF